MRKFLSALYLILLGVSAFTIVVSGIGFLAAKFMTTESLGTLFLVSLAIFVIAVFIGILKTPRYE